MALVSVPGLYMPPLLPPGPAVPPAFNTGNGVWIVSTTRTRGSWIFQVPKSGTLDMFEFWWFNVTTAQPVRVSFQGVDSSGNPDGSTSAYRDIASPSVGWAVPGLMTDDGTNGGVKLAVTQGDWLAVVIQFVSTTGDVRAGGVTLATNVWNTNNGIYLASYNGTVWAKDLTIQPIGVLKYDDGSYACADGLMPFNATTTTTFNSGSTPDERGLILDISAPVRVVGGWVAIDLDNNADLVLYDTNGTSVLASVPMVAANRSTTAGKIGFYRFASAVTLAAGNTYRIVVKPGASSVSTYTVTVASAAIMAAMPGGADWHLTTRTDAGSWSETTTLRPLMGLVIDAIDDGTGSGGGGEVVSVIG